jgi:hypothetical protein
MVCRRHGWRMPWLAAISILPWLIGCGTNRPETVPLDGTVTLDGKPLAGAGVLLMPERGGRPATGTTDEAGHFRLSTFEPGDGALLGKHTVTVIKRVMTGVIVGEDGMMGVEAPGGAKTQWITPPRYADPKTSGLAVDVQRPVAPLVIELKSR